MSIRMPVWDRDSGFLVVRAVNLFLPADWPAWVYHHGPMPVVLLLHGGNGNADGFAATTCFHHLCRLPSQPTWRFIAVFVDGLGDTQADGSSSGEWGHATNAPSIAKGDDVGMLHQILERVVAGVDAQALALGVTQTGAADRARLYIGSFSAGSKMGSRVVVEFPQRFPEWQIPAFAGASILWGGAWSSTEYDYATAVPGRPMRTWIPGDVAVPEGQRAWVLTTVGSLDYHANPMSGVGRTVAVLIPPKPTDPPIGPAVYDMIEAEMLVTTDLNDEVVQAVADAGETMLQWQADEVPGTGARKAKDVDAMDSAGGDPDGLQWTSRQVWGMAGWSEHNSGSRFLTAWPPGPMLCDVLTTESAHATPTFSVAVQESAELWWGHAEAPTVVDADGRVHLDAAGLTSPGVIGLLAPKGGHGWTRDVESTGTVDLTPVVWEFFRDPAAFLLRIELAGIAYSYEVSTYVGP